MATFALDLAAIAPSIEIVNKFKEITTITKAGGNGGLRGSTESSATDVYKIAEMIAKNLALDTQYTHEVFTTIDEQSRPRAWRHFLNTTVQSNSALFESACQEEQKPFDAKIRDDAFRTFKGDTSFWSKVSEESLIRVLNAISVDFGYVQGMNVLLGPFLYIMPEVDSYVCMRALLHDKIPRYVLRNLDGAHDGARLFARCLRLLDAKLFTHLSSKIPDLSIFSLRYILTLFANSRPLSEVLKLWDAILAVGVHFNILLLCSKLMLMRETLLKEKRGAKIMQLLDEAPIQSGPLIDGAFCLLRFIPASLLHELLAHATSKTVPTTPVDTPPPSAPNSSNALLSTPGGTLSARGIAVDAQYSVNTEINAHAGGNSGFHGMTRAVASVSISSGTTDSPGGPVLKLDSRSVESSLESVFSHALSTSRSIESLVGPHLDAHAGHSHPGSACGTPSDTTSATSRADATLSDS